MSEEEVPTDKIYKCSRRQALRLGGLAAAGLAIKKETKTALKGYFTHNGVNYFPMYESHIYGPEATLPANADIIFLESNIDFTIADGSKETGFKKYKYDQYTIPIDKLDEMLIPGKTMNERGIVYQPPERKARLIQQVKEQRIPLALGDIDVKEEPPMWNYNKEEDIRKFYAGVLTSIGSQLPDAVQKRIDRHKRKMSRRRFLTLGLGATGGLFGSWLLSDTEYFKELTLGDFSTSNFNRFLLRLRGLTTHLHPEDPEIFTRNLVMALKMKNLGEWGKQREKHPLIAFNVGAAHGGIEDFIYLPTPVLRTMIAYINREWLQKSTDLHTPHNFCSTRIVQSDDNGNFQDYAFLTDKKLETMLGKKTNSIPKKLGQ